MFGFSMQVYKSRPNDKDAKTRYMECRKIDQKQRFEKAIAVDDSKKASLIDVDAIGMQTLTF